MTQNCAKSLNAGECCADRKRASKGITFLNVIPLIR